MDRLTCYTNPHQEEAQKAIKKFSALNQITIPFWTNHDFYQALQEVQRQHPDQRVETSLPVLLEQKKHEIRHAAHTSGIDLAARPKDFPSSIFNSTMDTYSQPSFVGIMDMLARGVPALVTSRVQKPRIKPHQSTKPRTKRASKTVASRTIKTSVKEWQGPRHKRNNHRSK